MGDFNAHNELWNCEKTDRIGESLLKELEQNDMFIVNSDTKSRQDEIGQKTPTWTWYFSNDKVYDAIEYYQESDNWGSDHFPISFKIEINYELYSLRGLIY